MKIGSIGGKLRAVVAFFAIVYILIPLLVTIPASFTTLSYPTFPPHGFSLQWYEQILEYPEFVDGFINSIEIALLASLISVVLGTLSAIALSKYQIPGKSYIVSLLTAPLSVPQIVLGVALLIYFTPIGLSGTTLGFVIGHAIVCVPYVVRFVLTGMAGFDYTLERAGSILGANPLQVFFKITLPLLRPAMLSGAVFSFLTSFDNVTVSLFIGSTDKQTLPYVLFARMMDSYDPLVASVSTVVIVISVLIIVVLEKIQGVGQLYTKEK